METETCCRFTYTCLVYYYSGGESRFGSYIYGNSNGYGRFFYTDKLPDNWKDLLKDPIKKYADISNFTYGTIKEVYINDVFEIKYNPIYKADGIMIRI